MYVLCIYRYFNDIIHPDTLKVSSLSEPFCWATGYKGLGGVPHGLGPRGVEGSKPSVVRVPGFKTFLAIQECKVFDIEELSCGAFWIQNLG